MSQTRRLTAILVADVVGYSRLMEADEAGTLAALKERRAGIPEPVVKAHGGRVVKFMGEGVLVGNEGILGNVLKIRPPIVFSKENAEIAVAAMDRALAKV